ncbi:hypothetical protein BJ165DRAFT_1398356 [Panaeolus papilionaceus]|nr:hypothetical protein BJ165DRAFT_1398356 [Panaeolus papilionaceus]
MYNWDHRCFSSFHKTIECPTWWRIYEYFSEAQQHTTLERRLEKKGLQRRPNEEKNEDEDDWFGSRTNTNASGNVKAKAAPQAPMEPKKMHFGFSLDAKKKAEQGSLLARLEVSNGGDFVRSEKDGESQRGGEKRDEKRGTDKRDRDRDKQGGSSGSKKSSKRDRGRRGRIGVGIGIGIGGIRGEMRLGTR